MRDKMTDIIITKFAAVRDKTFALKTQNDDFETKDSVFKKAKGIKKVRI